jgi:hypothetical protein
MISSLTGAGFLCFWALATWLANKLKRVIRIIDLVLLITWFIGCPN